MTTVLPKALNAMEKGQEERMATGDDDSMIMVVTIMILIIMRIVMIDDGVNECCLSCISLKYCNVDFTYINRNGFSDSCDMATSRD